MFQINYRVFVGALVLLLLSTASTFAQNQVLFFEDFESGDVQWPIPGSMNITTLSASAGSHSQTFTRVAAGGDARTFTFAVTPGTTYYLHVDYMTLGGGGYIGIDRFGASMQNLGVQWLLGDGGFASLGVFDFNISNQDPADLGVWKQ